MDNNEKPVRIMSVLPTDLLKKLPINPELNTLRMYQVLDEGVIKENAGIKRSHHDYIVYDVTNASDDLKRQYADFIKEIEVREIIKEKTLFGEPIIEEPTAKLKGKTITTLLSLLGEYKALSQKERDELGYDFVNVESSIDGIKITPIFREREFRNGETYLRIDEKPISPELFEKISSDITELTRKENGLYEFTGYTEETKKEL